AMGGTEFPLADVASTNTTYWQAASGSDFVSSALSYIPEQVWNDDSSLGLGSGGGGVSTFTSRPSWQTGVTGIPSGTFRFVPDISLSSSPNNAGYLFCSSDTLTRVTGSCTNGFRDSSNVNLTVAGGTSFAAPIFAGMLAIIYDPLSGGVQFVIDDRQHSGKNRRRKTRTAGDSQIYIAAISKPVRATSSDTLTRVTGSCTNGFRDSSNVTRTAGDSQIYIAAISKPVRATSRDPGQSVTGAKKIPCVV